ncbi:unnamed protein product [Rangifer tarandus platyrhynchus]|uniref:Uncharacterized protein n=2 Tax=Rangifer tarandus platyrhynchus TaxID=3082113 RepID=A0ABN8Y1C9_RANTA|nr:unnamed protein product [Rangifer tarandus platyrhynchus]CAI9692860.1 unnamed protein product [Rangifer tarandus platyrhynchus]
MTEAKKLRVTEVQHSSMNKGALEGAVGSSILHQGTQEKSHPIVHQVIVSWTMAQAAGPGACAPVATPRSFPEPEGICSTASGCADNPPESSTLKNRGLQSLN